MEDPNLIMTITGPAGHPAECIKLPHNSSRYITPLGDNQDTRSRSPSAEYFEEDGNDSGYNDEPRGSLQLTFNNPPKDITRGFVFGTEKKICDVLLARRKRQGISGVHFCITFESENHLVLRDISTKNTAVSYNRWGEKYKRRGFKWILNLDNEPRKISIHLFDGFRLDITLPNHASCLKEYYENVNSYVKESQDSVLALGGLNVPSQDPTRQRTPLDDPIYFPLRIIGSGTYGTVWKVIDVSTGISYASKKLHSPVDLQERAENQIEAIKTAREEFESEMRIMKYLVHDHIVQFVCSTVDPLQIIMEFMPLGNLRYQHKVDPIDTSEIQLLLAQALDALRFMHSANITHRDVKPENILVGSRKDSFSIKLSDFGFSKVGSSLKSHLGTPAYEAPELSLYKRQSRNYDSKVDIWALGVVILEYTYGVPTTHCDYHEAVASAAEEALTSHPNSRFFFMLSRMLQADPRNRASAIELFEGEPTIDFSSENSGGTSGSITPTNNRSPSIHASGVSTPLDSVRQVPAANIEPCTPKRQRSCTNSSARRVKRPRNLTNSDTQGQFQSDKTVKNVGIAAKAQCDAGSRRCLENSYQADDAGDLDCRQSDATDGKHDNASPGLTSRSEKQRERQAESLTVPSLVDKKRRHDPSAGAAQPLSGQSRNTGVSTVAASLTSNKS
ncbi:serine/threonine-protein kinase [Histoplasma capsulatum G186AR]|uniref:Serine/threonine-protein kinase n=2 Tax=Ajellomyces capsulatus TaxID=5037 RepID=C0NVM8_AJECG|nr:serine/threonine-protein kinase [Histoplasma capsulatum G186AR]EEH04567.1 serine/threonine-protein kinase [Histoplasma capsulatum G186AR]